MTGVPYEAAAGSQSITPPIIFNDGGDLDAISTLELAELELEPEDVRSGLVELHDSHGLVLDARVDTSNRTVIEPQLPITYEPDDVLIAIRRFASRVPGRLLIGLETLPEKWTLDEAVLWLASVSTPAKKPTRPDSWILALVVVSACLIVGGAVFTLLQVRSLTAQIEGTSAATLGLLLGAFGLLRLRRPRER